MKNNILSKLSFVFVAIFSFIAFNGLVKAETVVNITSESDLIEERNRITGNYFDYHDSVVWDIQSDITISSQITLTNTALNLTINGNGHTITATQTSNTYTSEGYVLSFNIGDYYDSTGGQLSINDLNIIVGNGFRSGVNVLNSKSSSITQFVATLKNVDIEMTQTTSPVKNGSPRTGCPLVINHLTVNLKGNNQIIANEYSWAAVDLTSNSYHNAILEIKEGATLNIVDERSDATKITKHEPVVKATIKDSSKTCEVVNPERANLAKGENSIDDENKTVYNYYLRVNEVRITMPEIKVGNVIPSSIAVTGTPTGSLKASTVPMTCYVSDTNKETAPTDEEVATGIFEDGKYYYCNPANIAAIIDESYIAGDFTKLYVNGEEVDSDYFNKWIKTAYTYEVKEADKLSFDKGKIETLVLTVDGDYSLFESLKVGDLTLEKDTDYKVTSGSTVITFTEEGLAKLNKLAKGNYDVEVKYTNGKTVTTTLTIDEIVNPKTGVSVPYIVLGVVVLIGIISLIVVKKKYNN